MATGLVTRDLVSTGQNCQYFKGTAQQGLFHEMNPPEPMANRLKYFRFCRVIRILSLKNIAPLGLIPWRVNLPTISENPASKSPDFFNSNNLTISKQTRKYFNLLVRRIEKTGGLKIWLAWLSLCVFS